MKTPTTHRDTEEPNPNRTQAGRDEDPRQREMGGFAPARAGTRATVNPLHDAATGYTLDVFAVDFLANLPAGAETGKYVAVEGDRWSDPEEHPWHVDTGKHNSHGWFFTFSNGRFVEAERFVDNLEPPPAV